MHGLVSSVMVTQDSPWRSLHRTVRKTNQAAKNFMASALCGGFRVVFEEGPPQVREVPGEGRLRFGTASALGRGLAEAPELLSHALRLRPPRLPWKRVEVTLVPGTSAAGEALPVAEGCIRLQLGESAPAAEAQRIARHEALHLLLAA